MDNGGITRIKYFRGQMLTARDFDDQQEYHRNKQKLLLRRFPPGIIGGLTVTCDKRKDDIPNDFDGFLITEGLAVDPKGNQIIVPEGGFKEPVTNFDPDKRYLSLEYFEQDDSVGDGACGNGQKNNRVKEQFRAVWDVAPNINSHITVALIELEDEDAATTCDKYKVSMKENPGEPRIRQDARVVDTDQITDGAITESKIKNWAVTTFKIADNAVISIKIADNAVTEDKIEKDAVTEDQIKKDAVTEDKIKKDAVTEDKIKKDAVTEDKIKKDAVTEDKIKNDAVTENKIKNDAVTEDKIKNDAVTEDKIKKGAVTEDKLKKDAVTEDKLKKDAVTEDKIKKDAVTEDKIKKDAVTEDKIKKDAVTEDKIKKDAVTEDKIKKDAVTEDKIKKDAVTGIKIFGGAVTSDKLNLITTTNLSGMNLPYGTAPSGTSDLPTITRISPNSILQVIPTSAGGFSWTFRVDFAADGTLTYTISVTNPGAPVGYRVQAITFN